MGRNIRKFAGQKFIRTVDLGLFRRLLERHRAQMPGFDFAVLDGDEGPARAALQALLLGPDDGYPDRLKADLHRIGELGTHAGLGMLREQAQRLGVTLVDADHSVRLDPKHVAVLAFLDRREVFDAASDMLVLDTRESLTEFDGLEEGIEPRITDQSRARLRDAAREMFAADLQGRYCRVGSYEDDDEVNIVVTHGTPITTTEVVDDERDAEEVISYRASRRAVLRYVPLTGRVKVGGVPLNRRAQLAEIFAVAMLGRPGFFAGADSRNLYTLAPIERAGFSFTFDRAFASTSASPRSRRIAWPSTRSPAT